MSTDGRLRRPPCCHSAIKRVAQLAPQPHFAPRAVCDLLPANDRFCGQFSNAIQFAFGRQASGGVSLVFDDLVANMSQVFRAGERASPSPQGESKGLVAAPLRRDARDFELSRGGAQFAPGSIRVENCSYRPPVTVISPKRIQACPVRRPCSSLATPR